MSNPFPEIPAELLPKIGEAAAGWNHATSSLGVTLPSRLQRANLIRRGALLFLNQPKPHRRGR